MVNGRFHCKKCARNVCQKCSNNRRPLSKQDQKEGIVNRVCDRCDTELSNAQIRR